MQVTLVCFSFITFIRAVTLDTWISSI
jgi:hypothetical protein